MDAVVRTVAIVSEGVCSPLGRTSAETYERVRAGATGLVMDPVLQCPVARTTGIHPRGDATYFETLCHLALGDALGKLSLPPARTLFILSTTKGNIELLEQGRENDERIGLHETARRIAGAHGFTRIQVISNACISGVLALVVARRQLMAGDFDHAVVLGADRVGEFVLSGFRSLQAMSSDFCRPFDARRNGINLGEAAAAIVLSARPSDLGVRPAVAVTGGAITNDANHISGPSRTGVELAYAITRSLAEAGLNAADVGHVCSHGTATRYNDEMESRAFAAAGVGRAWVNSLKGYFGHTLGAAGVLESIITIRGMVNNEVIATKGYEAHGVPEPTPVAMGTIEVPLKRVVKTASGFGGCNAAVVFEKMNGE